MNLYNCAISGATFYLKLGSMTCKIVCIIPWENCVMIFPVEGNHMCAHHNEDLMRPSDMDYN